MVSFRYVLVFLNFLHDIFSIKFYTISFLCKHNFFIDEKHTQWMLDTKVKVFHESILCFMKWSWNCISWNPLKEKFHSVSFPLDIVWWVKSWTCLVINQLLGFLNKFFRMYPMKLIIGMLYHMINTFWYTAFRYLLMYL